MVETIEHLIEQVAVHPKHSRSALFKQLLHSETYILNIGVPLRQNVARISRSEESFDIWADKDAETGGVWVPVFVARDTLSQYVSSKDLQAPAGKEFLWMELAAGQVFSLLRGVGCFAGLSLYLDPQRSIPLSWSDVKSLAEGRIPHDDPKVYESPIKRLVLPAGIKLTFGHLSLGGANGKLLYLPEAGHFKSEDIRKLVQLDLGSQGTVWIACRHFLQMIRHFKGNLGSPVGNYFELLLESMVRFEMYGEAEALCEWLSQKGYESFSWVSLAAIYGKTSRFEECVTLCRRGFEKYREETAFLYNEVMALTGLGRGADALERLNWALERFPQDAKLLSLRHP